MPAMIVRVYAPYSFLTISSGQLTETCCCNYYCCNAQQKAKNFHAVLGVRNGASNKEIKAAYHKLALKWHPDKHPNDKLATKKFQE
jgi:hypothetical protein